MTRSVVVCAHRGNSGEFPENTLSAFRSAADLGVDMIEFDVAITKDGVPVILHDETVDRTSNGTGLLAELTLAAVRALDFGSWQGEAFCGERIPTLIEALDALPAPIMLNIHVKEHWPLAEDLVGQVAREFRLRDLYHRAFVASDETMIRAFAALDPRIRLCSLSHQDGEAYIDHAEALGCRILQPCHTLVTAEFVAAAHQRDMRVNVFYADEEAEMLRQIDCGVDGILTNYPRRLLALQRRIETNHDV